MTDLRIKHMRLDEFISRFHPDNPKQHDLNYIGGLIDHFGFKEFPTIDERSGLVSAFQKATGTSNQACPPARVVREAAMRGIRFVWEDGVKLVKDG